MGGAVLHPGSQVQSINGVGIFRGSGRLNHNEPFSVG